MKLSPKNPIVTKNMLKAMRSHFADKVIADEPVTFVDIYGYLIAKTVLSQYGPRKYSKDISKDLGKLFGTGERLLPIGTAIMGREPSQATNTFLWLEMTPFMTGSHDLQSYIPTRAFGELFKQGHSVQRGPRPYLGFLTGIMGSAFAFNMDYFKQEKSGNKFIDGLIGMDAITDLRIGSGSRRLGGRRPLATEVNNFTFADTGINPQYADYMNKKRIVLADAGLDHNLPFVPLIERKERGVDMIIVFDSSAGITEGEAPGELIKAINYFKRKGVEFPAAELAELKDFSSHKVSVLKSADLTIMYVPISCSFPDAPPKKVCDTFNFTYSPAQVEQLSNLSRNLIVDNKCLFYNEIQDIITRK